MGCKVQKSILAEVCSNNSAFVASIPTRTTAAIFLARTGPRYSLPPRMFREADRSSNPRVESVYRGSAPG